MGNSNKKNEIRSPIFKLNKFCELRSSIYYGYELKDGRICLCISGSDFNIYNHDNIEENKEDLRIDDGYSVSSVELHNGYLVVVTYGPHMIFYSINGNTYKEVQRISAKSEAYRENFVSQLLNGQLITMDWYGRIKLYNLIDGLYKEVKCFQPMNTFQAEKMKEIKENIIILRGWNHSNEDYKLPLYLCDLNNEKAKMIKDNCVDFDIFNKKNIIIFNKNSIEMFDIEKFKATEMINLPDVEIKTGCLYNSRIVLIGCNNEEIIGLKIHKNKLIEIERTKIKCHINHKVQSIFKLKNNSFIAIGDTEIYIFDPIQ